jgi:cytochrome c553
MRLTFFALFLALGSVSFAASGSGSDGTEAALEKGFSGKVHPFIETYCVSCHGKDKPEAELDLTPYATMAGVVSGFSYWELVMERLEAGEMPPEKAKKHPTEQQSREIVEWIKALRKNETQKNAGDPGVVLARRLSNAEYDYTIHDLTGVDIRPTKEFPVDPANQAGFANTGESLTMSPALWKKYYQAARAVADNLVLQPEGFTFAPHPMLVETDRDKYSVLRIVDFYLQQPTDFSQYFLAAWRFQHRAALGQPTASLADVAKETRVSARYLSMVWEVLSDPAEQVGPIAKLQKMFRALPAPSETEPAVVRARTVAMRDWVLNLRDQIIPEVPNLNAGPFRGGSQPTVLWKNREMAANHRKFDPKRLKVGTPPPDTLLESVAASAVPAAETPAAPVAPVLMRPKTPVAVVNPTPKMGQKLASGLGTPVAPIAAKDESGRQRSALEISVLAEAAQPARKAGGPLPKTPDIVKFGGVFLDAPVKTTTSSVTAKMARAKARGDKVDPDLFVPEDPTERARHEAAFAKFADVFPDAFFISERARVYLDAETEATLEGRLLSAGLHSQTGYFRDDTPLYELILDDGARKELDRLWDIFNFNAAVPARMHLAFLSSEGGSLRTPEFDQYRPENKEATTPAMIQSLTELTMAKLKDTTLTPVARRAIDEHFARTAADNLWLDQTREAAIPSHLRDLQAFAQRAYRRPLTAKEREDIVAFYQQSRTENHVDHEDAMRDSIVRILISPYFCYRLDLNPNTRDARQTGAEAVGARAVARPVALGSTAPVALPRGTRALSDYELASRLSYFLWSSMPDDALMASAAKGELQQPEVLVAHARRMLKDRRVRNLAAEFAGHWLDFRRFEEHNAVDRERFPSFDNDLRQAMFEEPLRFFADVAREDRSVLNFLYGDYTFVNAPLAKHYGIPGTFADDTWTRVDNASQFDRGGLLPMAVFLTANSPGLRTSPVKRGYWVVRRVLGERIPPPPPTVPDLPADEKGMGELTLRETLAKHRADPACASCHARFDSFGLVFEGYGAIGERRAKDFGGRAVDTRAEFPGGVNAAGFAGLRDYIRAHREGDFIDNLASKLLSYGLGRSLLMSDDLLLAEMKTQLKAENHRFGALIETIVTSPQFRTRRTAEPVKTAANP